MAITPPVPHGTPGAVAPGQAAQFNPYADPAYVALLNGLNLSRSTAEANTRGSEDDIRQRLAQLLPQISDSHVQGRKQISGSEEARGFYRSGEHEQKLALDRQQEGQQVGDAQMSTTQSIADLERQLATQRAGFENQAQGGYADAYNQWYSNQQQKAAQAEAARQAAAQQAQYYSALSSQQAQQNQALKDLYGSQLQQGQPAAASAYPGASPGATLAPGVTQQQATANPIYYDQRGRPVYTEGG